MIEREMQPVFETLDFLNLSNHHFYVKLMIEGAPSRPFSARSIEAKNQKRRLGSSVFWGS